MADRPRVMLRLCALLFLAALRLPAQSPAGLRCEWQTQPLAIQTEAPRFSWIIEAPPQARDIRQTAYRVIVSDSKQAISRHVGELWDSGKVASSHTFEISYSGKKLASSTAYFWSVEVWDQEGNLHWSASTDFQTGLLHEKDWTALWISAVQSPEREKGLPLLRREFAVGKKVARAIVYLSGLGQYELRLNGQKVGSAVLAPGWTYYSKTVLYNAFDITTALRRGDNAFGVALGNGMYNVEEVKDRYTKFKGSFGVPKLLFQAQVTYTDGSTLRIISDHNWHTVQGPTVFSSLYGGEDYDARLEQPGWDKPGYREKEWLQAQETEGPGGKLVSQQIPPIEVSATFSTVKVTQPQPVIRVYDLGQNFAGWPQLSIKGPRGSSAKLIAGELLDRQGLASQRSTGGPEWFTYTLKGDGIETWHPSFSYWGFRYVEVELTPDAGVFPEVLSVSGQFIHATARRTGSFESSSELLNKTHQLIDRAIESNLQSVLTDCPHREKLGWLEESHLLASALTYNFDLATLYEKIVHDMADNQQSDGLIPDIAPEFTIFESGFRDSPEWGSAYVLDPWLTYQAYGDREIISSHYEGMKKYAAYLASKASGNIISYGLGDWYDIGPGEPGESKLTSLGVTATATYYQDLTTLENCAKILSNSQDELAFRKQAEDVRQAFNKKYYSPDIHVYDQKSQTDYAMPLVTGLAPTGDRDFLLEKLVADIQAHHNHVTAGDIGFHYVVEALMDGGRSDVLFDMLSRTDAPSYGYQLKQGATALTEAWDANPLHSQNHFMLGHAEEWFYRGLAGIDFDLSRPESQRLIIKPFAAGGLTSVSATFESVFGKIASRWTRADGVLTLTIDIPANLAAQVRVPAGNVMADNPAGVTRISASNDSVTYQVTSGHYVFRSR